MGKRLSKIYTRTGDNGQTGMADGSRVSKSALLFEVMGDVDELNSHIGLIRAYLADITLTHATFKQPEHNKKLNNTLCIIQHLLFNLGGELALSNTANMSNYQGILATHIEWLEQDIDAMNAQLSALEDFILPTGSVLVSQLHIARCVCRRAERHAVALSTTEPASITAVALSFLNRLSDWLFVTARYCTDPQHTQEVLWDSQILQEFE